MTVEHASSGAPWQPLVQIGDISADQHWVRTPSGSLPTTQVTWSVQDLTRREIGTPTYATVLAIVLMMWTFFLSLLLLLVREERTTGSLQVTVRGPGLVHTTCLLVSHPGMVADVYARVGYVQSLTAGGHQQGCDTSRDATPAGM